MNFKWKPAVTGPALEILIKKAKHIYVYVPLLKEYVRTPKNHIDSETVVAEFALYASGNHLYLRSPEN